MNSDRFGILSMLRWSVLAMCLLMSSAAWAQFEDTDSIDEYVRENPELGDVSVNVTEVKVSQDRSYSEFPFLHLSANKIDLNGADWSGLRGLFAAAEDTLISIVHIGDSHIQAEGSTSRTRSLLQDKYGSAGRGLIIPFRLAGSNQALDYSISSSSSFTVARLLKRPWPIDMGFTGIALSPKTKRFNFTIATKEQNGKPQDFEVVKMFGNGAMPQVLSALKNSGEEDDFEEYVDGDTLTIYLSDPVTEITLNFESRGECEIFGFLLDNLMAGVQYSAIGNNGATFSSYNSVGNMGQSIKPLSPALVVLSLGTNEAFGKVSDETLYSSIDVMVKGIKDANPDCQILLVTPAECQRSKRTGRGRKRVKTYSVNENIPRLRNVILKYGRDNGVATYDWYDVAGGEGSSAHWLDQGLMNTDRIHDTWSGYALHGSLLYDALIDVIDN